MNIYFDHQSNGFFGPVASASVSSDNLSDDTLARQAPAVSVTCHVADWLKHRSVAVTRYG